LLDCDHAEASSGYRTGHQVDGQLSVTGFEDVQRKRCTREQYSAQRKQWNGLGHTLTLRRGEPIRSTTALVKIRCCSGFWRPQHGEGVGDPDIALREAVQRRWPAT
jgi:hypothetical protein